MLITLRHLIVGWGRHLFRRGPTVTADSDVTVEETVLDVEYMLLHLHLLFFTL